MSQVPYTSWFDLELPSSPEFRRELKLKQSMGYGLTLWMFNSPSEVNQYRSLSYASAPFDECRLDLYRSDWSLHIGNACFGVSAAEAKQLVDTFAPHGLKIKSLLPCADPPSLPSAKQAAAATLSLRGGDRGVMPPSDCESTGGGSSEASNCTLVQALTAHEHY